MFLLYQLLGLAFIIGFFMLLFMIAWYIAVPLLILAVFIWLIQQLMEAVRFKKPIVLKKRRNKKKAQADNVIDVEWTEV